MGTTIILARILLPEHFGLVAILASFLAVFSHLRDLGIPTAMVQAESLEKPVTNTLFLISILLAILVAGATIVTGKVVSVYTSEPRIFAISFAMAGAIFFQALEAVPVGLLRRNLKFREIGIRDSLIAGITFILAVVLACSGFSYWALVLPMSIAGFISLLLSLHAARWLPSRNISTFAEAKGIIVYGGTLALSTIANRVIQGIDLMLLGRYIPLGELGYYSRAKSLMTGTLQQALGPIAAVMIPVLSRLRNDPDKFNNWVRKISVLITLVAAPSSALISVNSSVIVQLLLGNSWSEAAPFFTVIALGIFLMSHGAYYYWILVATGNPATLVKSTWIGATITLVAVFVGLPWGGIGVALATMLSGIFLRAPVLIHLINQTGKVEKGLLTRAYVRSVVEVVVWYLILYSMSVGCSQIFDFSEVMAAILLALIALGFLAARVWLSKEGRELVLSLRGNIRENFSLRKR